jgi:hypothetical protein
MKMYLPKDMNVLEIPDILLAWGQVGQKVYLPTSKCSGIRKGKKWCLLSI